MPLLAESVWRCESCTQPPARICIFAKKTAFVSTELSRVLRVGWVEVGMEGEAFPTDTMASMDAVKVDAYGDTR